MKVTRHDPPPIVTPPATFTIEGLTAKEAKLLHDIMLLDTTIPLTLIRDYPLSHDVRSFLNRLRSLLVMAGAKS